MGMETDNPFEKVLDRLREKGWCKDRLGDKLGPNCLLGAAQAVGVFGYEWRETMGMLVQEHWPKFLGVQAPTVKFNNHPDTTFSDVERVLEKAAVKWEEERVLRDD